MNLHDYAHTMSGYNRWMNQRLYAACTPLPEELRRRDVGGFFKSIHGTLSHILLADRIWLGRFTGQPFQVAGLDEDRWPQFDLLRRERITTDEAITAWAGALRNAAENAELVWHSIVNPQQRRMPLRIAVVHFFNHQTHHRGQLTTLLKQQGIDPGVTDLIHMPEVA